MKALLIIILLAVFAFTANAQISSLSGQVTDQNGAIVTGAEVAAIAKNKTEFRAHTDSYGVYDIKLPAGAYRIEFTLTGCKNFVIPEYVIDADTNARLDAEVPGANCKSANTGTTSDRDFSSYPTIEVESRATHPEIMLRHFFVEPSPRPAAVDIQHKKKPNF
jgi:hypothetical protein